MCAQCSEVFTIVVQLLGGMEEWEALDVDDSDLSSFIRPCKRRHSNHDSPPKTLNTCHSQSPHPIPGPAGAVQAAMMQRRALADRTLPTQEFIHLIDESDGDFNTNAWLSALEFVRGLGMMDGDGVAVTPLRSIQKHLNFGMVPHHVLAVIKSCTPNGFGDMMLTLKDPTRTIGATVHRKVFFTEEEGQFRKDITVGSVLLLHKVAVFCPTSSASYLNITSRNIVKVFSKDSGPPSQQVNPTHSVRPPASGIAEGHDKSWMLGSTLSLPQERTEGIMSSLGLDSRFREVAGNDQQSGENLVLTSCHADNGNDRNQKAVLDKENLSLRHDNATPVEVICGGEMEDQPNPSKLGGGGYIACSAQGNSSSTNSVHVSDGQEKGTQNHLERRREIVNPKGSIPHWTEEQLDELLAFD